MLEINFNLKAGATDYLCLKTMVILAVTVVAAISFNIYIYIFN